MRNGIEVSYFIPFKLSSDVCGDNGLPVCPNATRILGVGEVLKSIRHPSLQQFIAIEPGKQDRLIIVQRQLEAKCRLENNRGIPSKETSFNIAKGLFKGIYALHKYGFIHQGLSPSNILYDQETKEVIIQDWFRFSLTGHGQMGFFQRNFKYCAPEEIIKHVKSFNRHQPSDSSSDIFSAGMILAELLLGCKLWKNKNEISVIRDRLQLLKENPDQSGAEQIAKNLSLTSHFDELDPLLLKVLKKTTSQLASERPTAKEVLEILGLVEDDPETFTLFDYEEEFNFPPNASKDQIIQGIPSSHLFQLWKLSGGDLDSELEKRELIKKQPGIGNVELILDFEANQANPNGSFDLNLDYFNRKIDLSLDSLEEKIENLNDDYLNPITSEEFESNDALSKTINDESKLPITTRESSIIYQLHRMLVFDQLLRGYPLTIDSIISQSHLDICPVFRGHIWACLLGVQGDTRGLYSRIDKCSKRETDRQIEVDIPRCHQYEPLIASPEGSHKLKRVIKAWLVTHPHLTYWQGLDSLTTPFLYVNYNREDLAFATMTKFIDKYMGGLFERDNAKVIQEYLAVFQQLITFHDPELANHLSDMDGQAFVPDLYAIPWFLTMFAHVFPINKMIYLWDTLLLRDSSFPLFVGVAIMTRLKRQLMSFTFNDCILSFSDMPDIDIHQVIKISLTLYRDTPKSCSFRVHQPEQDSDGQIGINRDFIDLDERRNEIIPRISPADVCRLAGVSRSSLLGNPENNDDGFEIITKETVQSSVIDRVLIVDIRKKEDFDSGTFPTAVSLPADDAFDEPTENSPFGSLKPGKIGSLGLIRSRGKNVIVLAGYATADAQTFAFQLLKLGYPKLCCLNGGFDYLDQIGATLTVPSS